MNEVHKISRRLDAARDDRVHVEEADEHGSAGMYANRPVLLKESAHVVSRRKAREERDD